MTDEVSKQMEATKSPAIQVKKDNDRPEVAIVTLSTGYRAKLSAVSASLIGDVTSMIKNPPVPTWHNEDKDRDEPNPGDPSYIVALADTERRRGEAAMDALIMFGVELIDPIPEDGKWLKKLKFMEKRGLLLLSAYDMNDPDDVEFLFKRYIAVSADDLITVGKFSGIRGDDVTSAEASFRGNAGGDTN